MADEHTPIDTPDPGRVPDDAGAQDTAASRPSQRDHSDAEGDAPSDTDAGSEATAGSSSGSSAEDSAASAERAEQAEQATQTGQAESQQEPELSEPAPDVGASRPPQRTAKVAAIVIGAVLAVAAAAVGAAWAVVAIADNDNDDDYAGHEQLGYDNGAADRESGRFERFERDRRERLEPERQERWERREQSQRDPRERREQAERDRKGQIERDDSFEPDKTYGTERCKPILSLGTGEDALTVVICNLPRAELPESDHGGGSGDFDYFEFKRGPGVLPFLGRKGLPWLDGDGWPFGGDGPFGRGEVPFGGGWLFERDGEGLSPDDSGGFWFGSEDGEAGEEGFCLDDDGEVFCLNGGEELSDEQREQLEELMESFRQFGLDDFLEDFLGESGLESWFDGASSGETDS